MASFNRYLRYRTAVLASAFTNTIFGLIRVSFLLAAISIHQTAIGGYDALQAATYVWLGQALIGPLDIWGSATTEFGARVKSGDIAVDFLRPISIMGSLWSANLGRALYEFLPRGLPPLVIGLLMTDMHFPANLVAYLLLIPSLLLAMTITLFFFVTLQLSALWTIENRGIVAIFTTVQQLLSGFLIPVSWFPSWLRAIASATPFPAMFQAPIDLVTERIHGWAVLQTLAIQVFWAVLLTLLGLVLLAVGRRKVVIQGG